MKILVVFLLFAETKAHYLKAPLRISSQYFSDWKDLYKGKLLQNVVHVKFEPESSPCLEMNQETHYCGIAEELDVMNDPEIELSFGPLTTFSYTKGDVVLSASIIDDYPLQQFMSSLKDYQREFIIQQALDQGYDIKTMLDDLNKITDENEEILFGLTLDIVCHGIFEGVLLPQPDENFLMTNLRPEWNENESSYVPSIKIHVTARQNSPFCKQIEKVSTGSSCQTGYMIPGYHTTFPLPFGFSAVCQNPNDTCIKTNGAEEPGRGICAAESQKIGCGNGCPDDEYCAMTSSNDVFRTDFVPKTSAEIAWRPVLENENRATVMCPLRGNIETPSILQQIIPSPYRGYDTPFCTCKKRLVEGSQCQYNINSYKDIRLDAIVPGFPSPHKYKNTELYSQRIDVGCAQNLVCKGSKESEYGNCLPSDGNCLPSDEIFFSETIQLI